MTAITKDQARDELRKARASFGYFCSAYWRIKDADGNVVPFKPNPPQARLISLIEEKRKGGGQVRVLILKARQR